MTAKSITVTSLRLGRSVLIGLLGGFIGSLVMGGLGYLAPTPKFNAPFFMAPFAKIGLSGAPEYVAGWVLLLVVGLVIGALYAVAANKLERLRAASMGRGVVWGIVAGIVTWLVYGLPALGFSVGFRADLVGALLGFSLVYGILLGAIYAAVASHMLNRENRQAVHA